MNTKDVFQEGGLLSQNLEGYEMREGQIRMAMAVETCIKTKRSLIVEGETGVGKSAAYLVPSIVHMQESGFRETDNENDEPTRDHVVVATANIALQEQIFKKDLPFLIRTMDSNVTFGLMKGRNNYLCANSLDEKLSVAFRDITDEAKEIETWAETTETGDKSELSFEPASRLWSEYSSSSEECLGKQCPQAGRCFANAAIAMAKGCDIIICNYHVMLVNAVMRDEVGKDLVLPDHSVLICDEAHKLADTARNFFGFEISKFVFSKITNALNTAAQEMAKSEMISEEDRRGIQSTISKLENGLDKVWSTCKSIFENQKGSTVRIRKTYVLSLESVSKRLNEIDDHFGFLIENATGITMDLFEKWKKHRKRCRSLQEELSDIDLLAGSDKNVYYIESRGDYFKLVKRAFDVASDLSRTVFTPRSTVVLTSATISVGGDFGFLKKEVGVRDALELKAKSPFDYRSQGIIVVSDKAPNPQEENYGEKVAKICEHVIREMNGRTLGLFTSYSVLEKTKEHLRSLTDFPFEILVQGEVPRTMLIDQFRKNVSSVLLGTESLWAGVDVQGESLSCVIVDKIPFRSPGDPVWEAMTERSENWFFDLAVPNAVISLKQGVGRLIRSRQDRGVVVILDNRMVKKQYGGLILRSLPDFKQVSSLRGIGRVFNGGKDYDHLYQVSR